MIYHLCCLPLEVSIFLIFLIFCKRTKSPPHGENVKRVALTRSNKQENILQSENNEVESDIKTFSFDPLTDYDESGCPKVPFVFSGMTGKTFLRLWKIQIDRKSKD